MVHCDAGKFLDTITTLGGYANPQVTQFLRYTVTASSSFVLDLILLWVLTELFHVYYLVSVGLAFAVAVSVNYVTSRAYAFEESSRGLFDGYVRFIGIALVGIGIIMLSVHSLVETLGFPYLVARIMVGCVAGVWNYTMNAYWNFRR